MALRVFMIRLLFLMALLLIVGCGKPVEEYIQENVSQPAAPQPAWSCQIGNATYYQKSYFLMHVNNKGDWLIYSPVGTYTKPAGYPRWQLRLYNNKEDSLYTRTLQYIQDRELPNGEPVHCDTVRSVPFDFQRFIDSHDRFFISYELPEAPA